MLKNVVLMTIIGDSMPVMSGWEQINKMKIRKESKIV